MVGDAVTQAIDAPGDGGEIIVMAHPTEVRTGASVCRRGGRAAVTPLRRPNVAAPSHPPGATYAEEARMLRARHRGVPGSTWPFTNNFGMHGQTPA